MMQRSQMIGFEFKKYSRRLKRPFELHGARMALREGIVIRLKTPSRLWSYGEIAPLPGFGTETFEDALAACEVLARRWNGEALPALPALEAGISMACLGQQDSVTEEVLAGVKLGALVLDAADVEAALQKGFLTFKLKVGRKTVREEFELYCRIVDELPAGGRVRLDVNGSWNAADALFWADRVDASIVEFIEQPFRVNDLGAHQKFLQDAPVPVALDESVSTAQNARRIADVGWDGLWVIKPALWGDWSSFLEFRQLFAGKIIYSSALETGIGQRAGIALALLDLGRGDWALGYGVDGLFEADRLGFTSSAEALWTAL